MTDTNKLNDREVTILESVIRNYITSASPTGSRFVAKTGGMELSPATIRNVMGDLEDKGFVAQPHTSAGRIPTDKGYRFYVDCLMQLEQLPQQIQDGIRTSLTDIDPTDLRMIMEAASRALSRATTQLGVILAPELADGIFRHLHIYPVGGRRYLINITIDSGFVKTVLVELSTDISSISLDACCRIINERFYGRTLREIFAIQQEAFADTSAYELGIIRLFIPSIQKMMNRSTADADVAIDGTANILLKPDFSSDKEKMSSIVEILDEKTLLMHVLGELAPSQREAVVTIGGEISSGQFSSFSVVKTGYTIGNMHGCLGIVGPKRMPYPYLVAAVEYTAQVLEEFYPDK